MNLPLITGNDPIESLVILYGFVQQNILFEALAGSHITGSGLDFLKWLADIFSMIGLLVLVFSPSLWKAKYVVSWFALFILVTSGGVLGPFFGYKFMNLKDYAVINTPRLADITDACRPPLNCNITGNNPVLNFGDKTQYDALIQAGAVPKTFADSARETFGNKTNKDNKEFVVVDSSNGYLSELNISGFMPQVIILYVTNMLRYSLQGAMNDMVNLPGLKERTELINMLTKAELPNKQLEHAVGIYGKLCRGVNTGPAPTKSFLAEDVMSQEHFKENLKARTFNAAEVTVLSNEVNKNKDPLILEPMFLLSTGTTDVSAGPGSVQENSDLIGLLAKDNTLAKAVTTFSINRSASNKTYISRDDLEKAKNNEKVLKYASEYSKDDLANAYNNLYDTKYLNRDTYSKYRESIVNSDLAREKVTMIIPIHNLKLSDVKGLAEKQQIEEESETETTWCMPDDGFGCGELKAIANKDAEDAGYNSQKELLGVMNKGDFKTASNCHDLLNIIRSTSNASISQNFTDLKDQMAYYLKMPLDGTHDADGNPISNNIDTAVELIKQGKLPDELAAVKFLANYIGVNNARCLIESGGNCNTLEGKIEAAYKQYKEAMFDKALGKAFETQNNVVPSHEKGAAGFAKYVGEEFTDAAVAPVSWLGSIGSAFKAGAYSAILPIIKNIIIAFILVLTPFLLLMGLLVPAWAPGVILTTLVALFYIKSVDVTMVLVGGLLTMVEGVFTQTFGDSKSLMDSFAYTNFMNIIWAMAYMSSFAITAFLLFAAGNTKAVISKMTGLDSTVKSTSQDIYQTGWKGAKMAASGVVAAPAMAGKAAAFAAITKEQGIGAAVDGTFGSVIGSYDRAKSGAYNSTRASLKKDSEADADSGMISVTDEKASKAATMQARKNAYNNALEGDIGNYHKAKAAANAVEDITVTKQRSRMSVMADDNEAGADKSRREALAKTGHNLSAKELENYSATGFTSGEASTNSDIVFRANNYGAVYKNGVSYRGPEGKDIKTDSAKDLANGLAKNAKLGGFTNAQSLEFQNVMFSESALKHHSGKDIGGLTAQKFKDGELEKEKFSFRDASEMYSITEKQFNDRINKLAASNGKSFAENEAIAHKTFNRKYTMDGQTYYGMPRVNEDQADAIQANKERRSKGPGNRNAQAEAATGSTKSANTVKKSQQLRQNRKNRNKK